MYPPGLVTAHEFIEGVNRSVAQCEYPHADYRVEFIAGKPQGLAHHHLVEGVVDILALRDVQHTLGDVHGSHVGEPGDREPFPGEAGPGPCVKDGRRSRGPGQPALGLRCPARAKRSLP